MLGYTSPAVNKGLGPPCYHENEHLLYHMDCAAEWGASVHSRYSMHFWLTLICVDWSQEGTCRDFRVLLLWNKELNKGLLDSGRNRDHSLSEFFQRWMLARELGKVRSPKVWRYQSPDPQWVIYIVLISSLFEDPDLFFLCSPASGEGSPGFLSTGLFSIVMLSFSLPSSAAPFSIFNLRTKPAVSGRASG